MAVEPKRTYQDSAAVRRAVGAGRTLAASMPRLILEARRVAATEPMSRWITREVFPGPEVQSDEELSELARAAHHTVYHVSGTCRIGAAGDPAAVVDPQLRVRGIAGLRVADASVFPVITTVNTVVTVLMVGERAADLIRAEG